MCLWAHTKVGEKLTEVEKNELFALWESACLLNIYSTTHIECPYGFSAMYSISNNGMHRTQTESLVSQKTIWLINGILANLKKLASANSCLEGRFWMLSTFCTRIQQTNLTNKLEEWKIDLGSELESRQNFSKNDSPVSQNLAHVFLQTTRFPIEAQDGRCLGEPSFVGLLWSLHAYWNNLTNNQRRTKHKSLEKWQNEKEVRGNVGKSAARVDDTNTRRRSGTKDWMRFQLRS